MDGYTEMEKQRALTIIRQSSTYVGTWSSEQLGQFKQPSELELMLKQAETVPVALRTMKYDAVLSKLQAAVTISRQYAIGRE